ncbi:MAG TPA: hypothetical protein VN493_29130 [Thermoanaerobaculia bacterium]|nr:hypothetical protein [Thermoanaerobaculia bacterium]
MRRSLAMVAFCLAACCSSALFAQVERGGALPPPLPIHPPDHWWNVDISAAPIDPNSTNFINFVGANVGLHPDFGGEGEMEPEIYGMVYITVPGTQPLQTVFWTAFGDQSDDGVPGRPIGYPIPAEAKTGVKWIEGGYAGNANPEISPQGDGDRHMLIVDRDNRILYELYRTFWNPAAQRWEADSGAIFKLDAQERRPEGWTSADAAGLAILPGLVRYEEVFSAAPIKHAFRMTVDFTKGYVWPASHQASTSSNSNALPMGARLRLKASKNISGYTPQVQKIFQAMKTYGLIVADNGSDMFITGAYDTRWDNGVLNPAFDDLTASDFEVIQLGWQPAVANTTAALDYYTINPCRLFDTRLAPGERGGPAVHPGQRIFVAAGQCGIPAGAKALAVNVTAVTPPASGHLRFFPGNATPTSATAINFTAGRTQANNAMIMLSSSGSGALGIYSSAVVPVHVVLDVFGYFQ